MAEYQHVVVVMSMVLGLAVTQLLKGVAQLYRTRNRVRLYWLHGVWVALLILLSFLVWWTYWNYREITNWNFFRFVLYPSPTIVLYFLAAIMIPDPSESVTDLKAYYYSNRVGFFGTFALYGILAGLTAMLVRGLPLLDPSNLFRALMVIFSLVAMKSAGERVHAAIAIGSAVMMLIFIVGFQLRLE